MRRSHTLTLALLCGLFFWSNTLQAQNCEDCAADWAALYAKLESMPKDQLFREANMMMSRGQRPDAKSLKGRSYWLMGMLMKRSIEYDEALYNFLEAAAVFTDQEKFNRSSFHIEMALGQLFQQWEAYGQAATYYKKALKRQKDIEPTFIRQTKINLASVYEQEYRWGEAEEIYQELLSHDEQPYHEQLRWLERLSFIQTAQGVYDAALATMQKQVDIANQSGTLPEKLTALNNLGVLQQKTGSVLGARAAFELALSAVEGNSSKDIAALKSNIQSNLGLVYTSTSYHKEAKLLYREALAATPSHQKDEQATLYNRIAANSFMAGEYNEAIRQIEKALTLSPSPLVEAESYRLLHKIHKNNDNFREAQEAFEKQQKRIKEHEEQEAFDRERLQQHQLEISRKEADISQLINERQQQQSMLTQLQLEAQNREQKLRFIKKQQEKEKELQVSRLEAEKLEREQITQALQLAEQQLQAEKRQQQITALQQDRELKDLEIQKQALEQQEREQEMQLLQAEKQLQDQKILEEERQNKFTTGFMILGLIIIIVIAFSLFQKQRANKKLQDQQIQIQKINAQLSAQQQEVITQNEELQQNQEEITAQRDFIERKNKELEGKNRQINSSIHAAELIQQAMLPAANALATYFSDNFLIYRPKDIVSGDFYWIEKKGDALWLIVADCTGHGVAGAFMTILGSSLFDKIISDRPNSDPASILTTLDLEIQKALHQASTGNNNGMDLVALKLSSNATGGMNMQFAGARNSCYVLLPDQAEKFIHLKGDRLNIGGTMSKKDRIFHNVEYHLPKGTKIYMGSDGFQDQNNLDRKKFSRRRLESTLLSHSALPMVEQQQKMESELDSFMLDAEQRDDILLLGVQV